MEKLKNGIIFGDRPFNKDLAGESVRGGLSTMTAQGVQFLLQLTGTIVLARLLTPEDYGIIGMVLVIVNFAQMFKEAGLSMATVQKEVITHQQISTLFWINIIISGGIGVCLMLSSPLISSFYGKPELITVTLMLSFAFIISGLSVQHTALLRRHLRFSSIAIIQISAQALNLVTSIVLALIGLRYWALVGGALATASSTVALTFFFCPWIPGKMRRGTGVRGMLRFGGHLIGFDFINYFARNADNILIGRYLGANALGLYSKAYQLFMMPIAQIRGPLTGVALPVLSSLQKEPDQYIKYYQRIVDIMSTLTVPLTIYCFLEAQFIIRLILGDQWLEVVPVFRVLAISGLIQPVAGTRGLVLLSYGYTKRYLCWGICNAVLCLGAFVVGIPYGIVGMAAAYAIVNYIILIPSLFYCFSKTPVTVTTFMKGFLPALLSGIISGIVLVASRKYFDDDSSIFHFFYLSIFVIIYLCLALSRESVRDTLDKILKSLNIHLLK